MAFDEKINLSKENGCLMDSDLTNIEGNGSNAPNADMSKTWIAKEYNSATLTGTGFSNSKGRITFFPVQVVADPSYSASILALFVYEATFSGSIGGFGQTEHILTLNDMCQSGQYVELSGVTINCSTDNEGFAVYGCPVETAKSNHVKFYSVNTDSSSTGTVRTFKVTVSGKALISNSNFGLGQLFPTNK